MRFLSLFLVKSGEEGERNDLSEFFHQDVVDDQPHRDLLTFHESG
jgi:hypothetical protein